MKVKDVNARLDRVNNSLNYINMRLDDSSVDEHECDALGDIDQLLKDYYSMLMELEVKR